MIYDGNILEITVRWAIPLLNLQTLHRKWIYSPDIRYNAYHTEFDGYAEAQRCLQTKCTESLHSTSFFSLLFLVQTCIHEKHNSALRDDGTKLVFVRLRHSVYLYTPEHEKIILIHSSLAVLIEKYSSGCSGIGFRPADVQDKSNYLEQRCPVLNVSSFFVNNRMYFCL